MISVFDYKNYKKFIEAAEDSRKSYERGFRSKLAEFLGCQSGYISHVLNGDAHFSLEQTMRVARFLSLKPTEQKYLLLLVEHARAGTEELIKYFQNELKVLKDQHLNIKERVGDSKILTEADQSIYYSSWHFLAVHVLSSLPEYNDARSIANALRIPEEVAKKVLLFLVQANILKDEKGKLEPGITQVHLNRESPLIRQHHTNWRIAAIQSLMNDNRNDVHYSTVSTLSKGDAEKLRSEMLQLIERYVEVIKPSAEEVMYGFNIDFYNLIK
jgi:uncharacterized protein (TIGR02147 family)